MSHNSPSDLLVLHAVRIVGFADTTTIAMRSDLEPDQTEELLRDFEAQGWTTHSAFAGSAGWSLTDLGRVEDERQLADELADTGGAAVVRDVYQQFLPLNGRLLKACTDWQLRPVDGDRLAPNDHFDRSWDARVLRELGDIGRALPPLIGRLTDVLGRFHGYDARFTRALARVRSGELDFVDRTDVDSCHRVWFELHEDLIATLGIERGAQP